MLKYKYAIGTHVMFYEIEMFSDFIDGMINLMSAVPNNDKANILLDFAFNVSEFFEKIDTSKISKSELCDRFKQSIERLNPHICEKNITYRIIDSNGFYTQTNYRREFNLNYSDKVDFLLWGETDSFFPRETFFCLESLKEQTNKFGAHRFVACFSDRKMWDSSWDPTVHPKFLNHKFIESDFENKNQAKSFLSIDEMNKINEENQSVDISYIDYPKIDGSCLVLSSDLIKSGVNIPPCFIHNDDESFSLMAKRILGQNYLQFIFKNVLKVHARRHPKKRLYVMGENNPNGFCNEKKGEWWNIFLKMSQHNVNCLFDEQKRFFTFNDFLNERDKNSHSNR